MTTVSLIKEAGLQDMSPDVMHKSQYYLLMDESLKKYPAVKKYIGTVTSTSGCGYGITVHCSFGLTFEGIRTILRMLKSKAPVADSLELLKAAIPKTDGQVAIVTSSSLLENRVDKFNLGSHAVSIFVQKKKDLFFVTLNDGMRYTCLAEATSKELFQGAKVVTCTSAVKRQQDGESTCNAIAITDCLAFENDPKLLQTIIKLNGLNRKHPQQAITKMPPSMLTLQNPLTARAKALEYQGMILEKAIAGQPLEESSPKMNARALCALLLFGLFATVILRTAYRR